VPPTWVWVVNVAATAAIGSAHRSPHSIDQVRNSTRRKGSTGT
jgi:hypothetical protein